MKKVALVLSSCLVFALMLAGCGKDAVEPDYTTKQFEAALNKGENLEGKTVAVTVDEFVPDSALGYNIQTGEHLNFVSSENPDVKNGDKVVLKAKKIESTLGSFIITYEKQ